MRAVRLLRDTPTERALLTGNGGYFTKHSMLVLGGEPPSHGYAYESVQREVDALPARPTPTSRAATGTIETYTVTHERDGAPLRAIVAWLDDAGTRHFTESREPDALARLLAEDCCGERLAVMQ